MKMGGVGRDTDMKNGRIGRRHRYEKWEEWEET